MDEHKEALTRAGRAYKRADDQLTERRNDLTSKARAAYAAGMKKADILRAMGHVWSPTWLDKILEGVERKTDQQG